MPSSLAARVPALLPDSLREHIRTARELERKASETPSLPPLATSVAPLDRLLEGGLPRGQLVELIGRRSCGRFSIVLATLASATGAAEAAALVDLGNGFDPQIAQSAGTALERLLWVHPTRLKEALVSTEMLLSAGFPLVVLDLGHPPVPGGRGAEASWLRLARAAASHDAALLVSSPYRVSGTAAGAVLKAWSAQPTWHSRTRSSGVDHAFRLLMGHRSKLTLERSNGHGTQRAPESLDVRVHSAVATERPPRISPGDPTPLSSPRPARASLSRWQ